MLTDLCKAPWPWFGGKQHAAPLVWAALGDPAHYCEPFCGTCAVLLRRPHVCNRTYHSETVNDADGLLINALRAIQLHPDETAEAASWYVSEACLMARHLAILKWRQEHDLERLMADPAWCDPRIAGYWLWGICCWIGSGWCAGNGPWIVGADGRITKRQAGGEGVSRQIPHISDCGMGVNHPGTREPGVSRRLPEITDDGRGVNHAKAREEGVHRKLPHLANQGMGVNHGGTREPGVSPGTPEREWQEQDFHPLTMPELRRWFAFLSARLRHVRILHGDWKRLSTGGALKTLPVRQGDGVAGVFLDPPYSQVVRAAGIYSADESGLSDAVREWCLQNSDDPDYRIVLAGFAGEGHEALEAHGWRAVEWYAKGHIRGGYANQGEGTRQDLERLWVSPHCLCPAPGQPTLFDNLFDVERV